MRIIVLFILIKETEFENVKYILSSLGAPKFMLSILPVLFTFPHLISPSQILKGICNGTELFLHKKRVVQGGERRGGAGGEIFINCFDVSPLSGDLFLVALGGPMS